MAKKDPAKIIAGVGWIMSFITELNTHVLECGGTAEDLYRLVKPEGRDTLRAMAKLVAPPDPVRAVWDHPIEFLGLGVRTYNPIKRAGIDYIGQLLLKTEEDLREEIPIFGHRSIGEIKEVLEQRGLTLAIRPAALRS